ncbi:Alpha-1,2 mannosyltransferase KTR1, partial [Hypsizygus marmoreus]
PLAAFESGRKQAGGRALGIVHNDEERVLRIVSDAKLVKLAPHFMILHPEFIAISNSIKFLSDNGGSTYNLCHFWSNFEIADMEFWRSTAYTAFFEYLDSKGGFYYVVSAPKTFV